MWDNLHSGWLSLQAWWQSLPGEAQAALRAAGVLLGAFLVSWIAGGVVRRRLRAVGFDASLRVPWAPPPAPGAPQENRLTPTRLAVLLVRLSVWAAAVWWLANEQGWGGLARTLETVAARVWLLAVVVVVALFLGRFLAEQVLDVMQSPTLKDKWEKWLPRASGREQRPPAALVLAGLTVYGLVTVLVLLVAADLLGWATTGSAAMAVWQLGLQLLTAAAALLIGWLGIQWARGQAPDAGAATPTAQAGYYTALGIVTSTSLLAITLLAGTARTLTALVLLLLLVVVLWPLGGYLPDLWAGLLLRQQKVREVHLEGTTRQLGEIGLILTHLTTPTERLSRRNRLVLRAYLQGPPPGPDGGGAQDKAPQGVGERPGGS
jgi:hypothetical protein